MLRKSPQRICQLKTRLVTASFPAAYLLSLLLPKEKNQDDSHTAMFSGRLTHRLLYRNSPVRRFRAKVRTDVPKESARRLRPMTLNTLDV
jgi:hypothetical protein